MAFRNTRRKYLVCLGNVNRIFTVPQTRDRIRDALKDCLGIDMRAQDINIRNATSESGAVTAEIDMFNEENFSLVLNTNPDHPGLIGLADPGRQLIIARCPNQEDGRTFLDSWVDRPSRGDVEVGDDVLEASSGQYRKLSLLQNQSTLGTQNQSRPVVVGASRGDVGAPPGNQVQETREETQYQSEGPSRSKTGRTTRDQTQGILQDQAETTSQYQQPTKNIASKYYPLPPMSDNVYLHVQRIRNVRRGDDYYTEGQVLNAPSRYVEFKTAGTKNLLSRNGQKELMFQKIAVAFLNSEGGTLLLGVSKEDRRVRGISMTSQEEDIFKQLFEGSMKRIRPHVFTSMYFVNVVKVRGDDLNLKVVEISMAQGIEDAYETFRGIMYERIDGNIVGPLSVGQIDELITKRRATCTSNVMLGIDVGDLKKELTKLLNIIGVLQRNNDFIKGPIMGVRDLEEGVRLLGEKTEAMEGLQVPEMTDELRQEVKDLKDILNTMAIDIKKYKLNLKTIEEAQARQNDQTRKAASKQEAVTEKFEKKLRGTNVIREAEVAKTRRLEEVIHTIVNGWHNTYQKAIGSLKAKVDQMFKALEKNSQQETQNVAEMRQLTRTLEL